MIESFWNKLYLVIEYFKKSKIKLPIGNFSVIKFFIYIHSHIKCFGNICCAFCHGWEIAFFKVRIRVEGIYQCVETGIIKRTFSGGCTECVLYAAASGWSINLTQTTNARE